MLQFVPFDQIKPGAVIKAIDGHGNWACIVFEDGTFTTIEAACAWETMYISSENDINLNPQKGPIGGHYTETYIELGVLTQEEVDGPEAEYQRLCDEKNRGYKLQQYHQLRKELGFDAEAQS